MSLSSFIGVDGTNTTLNSGRMLINLKPLGQRSATSQRRSSARLQREAARRRRHHALPAAGAGPDHRRRRSAAPSTSSSSRTPNPTSSTPGCRKLVDAAAADCRSCADVASDLQDQGLSAYVDIDRDTAARFGITAGDGRRRALRRLRPAHHLDHLHPVEPVPGDPRGRSRRCRHSLRLADADLSAVRRRRPGAAVGASPRCSEQTGAAADRPSRPVPGGDDLLQPRAGRLAGRRGRRDQAGGAGRSACRPSIDHRPSRARRCAFQASLSNELLADPGGDRHRLHRAGRALRELHPPGHDPLDPALGRRRRAAGADDRRPRPRRHRHHRHHPADRHRQEERDHDDRLRARRRARRGQERRARRSTRRACCASGRS